MSSGQCDSCHSIHMQLGAVGVSAEGPSEIIVLIFLKASAPDVKSDPEHGRGKQTTEPDSSFLETKA